MKPRFFLGAVSLCAMIGCGGESRSEHEDENEEILTPTIVAGCEDTIEELLPITSASHVDGDIEYSDSPPAGGDHNRCWATWGVHTEAVRDENWVHNLEHGGIVFLYNCPAGCDVERTELEGFAEGRTMMLVTPFSEMPKKFAAVAWGWRLVADCLDMEAFAAFYDAHVDNAPESIASNPSSGCL
jgi:hypothetical protein